MAFASLLEKFYPLLRRIASQYYVPGAERDDIMQEALIGFYHAVRDYSDEKSLFRSFVALCVHRSVITFLKTNTRQKHRLHLQAASLDAPMWNDEDDAPTLASRLPAPASLEIDEDHVTFIMALWKRCSPLERTVLAMYTTGYSFNDMGEETGTHYKSIDNAVWRVKVKAKKLRAELPAFEL